MADGVVAVTDETFQAEVLDAALPTVVDFCVPQYDPCSKIGPIVEELAADYGGRVRFASLDVEKSPDAPSKHAIASVPTLVLFKDGEAVDRIVAAQSKDDYRAWIDSKL